MSLTLRPNKCLAVSLLAFLSLARTKPVINDLSHQFGISFPLPFGFGRLFSQLSHHRGRGLPAIVSLVLRLKMVLGLSSLGSIKTKERLPSLQSMYSITDIFIKVKNYEIN